MSPKTLTLVCLGIFALFSGRVAEAVPTENITVTGYDRATHSFSLSIGARSEELSLWAAVGATDAGTSIADWDRFAKVRDVAANETTMSVPEPANWREGEKIRFFLLPKTGIPGLSRLDGLKPNGSYQILDYAPTGTTAIETDLEYEEEPTSNESVFCARSSDTSRDYSFVYVIQGSSGKFRFDYGERRSGGSTELSVGTPFTIRCAPDGVYKDGVLSSARTPCEFVAGSRLVLFGLHSELAGFGFCATAKIGSVRVYDDGETLSHDYVPVQLSNGDVRLYDRVGGAVLPAPSGAGSYLGGSVVESPSEAVYSSATYEPPLNLAISWVDVDTGILSAELNGVTQDSDIWIGYGDVDGGEDIDDWQNRMKVGSVSAHADVFSARIPELAGRLGHSLRLFLLPKGAIPGVAVLDEVRPQSAGFKPGFTPTGRTAVEMTLTWDTLPSGNETYFCARNDDKYHDFTAFHMPGTPAIRWDFYDRNIAHAKNTIAAITAGRTFTLFCKAGQVKYTDDVPTEVVDSFPAMTENDTPSGSEIVFFACHTSVGWGSAWATFRCHGIRIWTNSADVVTYDLVPAKKGDEVGFYNQANGTFMGSDYVIWGSLAAGNVVVPSGTVCGSSSTFTMRRPGIVVESVRRSSTKLAFSDVWEDSDVWAVCGDHDYGTDVFAWPSREKVGTVVAGTVSASVPTPAAVTANRGCPVRFFLVKKNVIPGSGEIAKCRTGSSMVRLDFQPTKDTQTELDVVFHNLTHDDGQTATLYTSRLSGSVGWYNYFVQKGGKTCRLDFLTVGTGGGVHTYASPLENDVFYTFTMGANGSLVNDAVIAASLASHTDETGADMCLFALQTGYVVSGSYADVDFYNCRIRENGEFVRDIVPACTNGGVCLYDRKTGAYYGAAHGKLSKDAQDLDLSRVRAISEPASPSGLLIIIK